jgi:hypothetical protein
MRRCVVVFLATVSSACMGTIDATGGGGSARRDGGATGGGGASGHDASYGSSIGGTTGTGGGGSGSTDVTSGSGGTGGDSAGSPDGGAGAGGSIVRGDAGVDCFGTKEIYPTKNDGREWCLPSTADQSDGEWLGGDDVSRTAEPGVFHVQGSPRVPVSSPVNKAWWRNVEMTVYLRLERVVSGTSLEPEWQLYARGERHTEDNSVSAATVNEGRLAPPGTITWPGYPFSGNINGHCLASSYKAYLMRDGGMFFKKEVSHIDGYTDQRGAKSAFPGGVPTGRWFGFKGVIRNFNSDSAVHMESWLDRNADGNWTKITEVNDTGGWSGGSNPDGCGAAPFSYRGDQLITWAGPHVVLRFDNLASDFKWMSAREIEPLP